MSLTTPGASALFPGGQKRQEFQRDWGNYDSFAGMPNGTGNILSAANFRLEQGDTCFLTTPTGLGARYTCVDPGTAGGGDAVWIFTGSLRPVFIAAAGSRDLTTADDGCVLVFTAVAGATIVVKSTLPERFSCLVVRYTGAGALTFSDDGGATTFVQPDSTISLTPSIAEAGGAVWIDILAGSVALLAGDLAVVAPSIAIAAAGPLIGDVFTAVTSGVVTTFQWYRGSVFGGAASETRQKIAGATSSTYARTAADVGYDITCDAIGPGGTTTSNTVAPSATAAAALGSTPTLDLPDTSLVGGTRLTSAPNTGSAGGAWTGTGANAPIRGSFVDKAVQQSSGSMFMTSGLTDANYFSTTVLELAFVGQVGTAALVTADVAANLWYNGLAFISDFDLGGPRFGVYVTKSGCYVGIYNGVAFVSTITTGYAGIKCDQPTVISVRLSTAAGGTLGITVGSGAEVTLAAAGAIDVLNNHLASFANFGATTNLVGKVAEPVGYNAAWTATQRSTIRAWLGNKYGAEY